MFRLRKADISCAIVLRLSLRNKNRIVLYSLCHYIQGNTINNLFNTGSSNPSSKFFSGYCHAENPNEYIRAIGIYRDQIFISVGSLDKDGNYKDPNVDKFVYFTIEEEHDMESKYQIGLPVDIRDKYISLLTGFKLNIDTRGRVSLSLMNDIHSDSYQLESGKRENLPFWKNPDYHIIVKDYYFSGGSFLSYSAATACDRGVNQNGNEYMWFEVDKYNARLEISFTELDGDMYIDFKGIGLSGQTLIVPFIRLYNHNKKDVGEPIYSDKNPTNFNSGRFLVKFEKNYQEKMILTYGFDVYDVHHHSRGRPTYDIRATYEGLNGRGNHGDVLQIDHHQKN